MKEIDWRQKYTDLLSAGFLESAQLSELIDSCNESYEEDYETNCSSK